jgi:hypothetical protein
MAVALPDAGERRALWQLCSELLDELQQPAAAPPPPLRPRRLASATAAAAGAPRDAKDAQLVVPEAAPRARVAGQRQVEPTPPEQLPQPPQLVQQSPQDRQPPPRQQQQQDEEEQQYVQDPDVRAARTARDARGLASPHAASGRLELLIEVDALRSSGAAAEALRSARLTVTLTSGAIAPPLVVLSRTCDASRVRGSGASATAGSLSPGSVQGSSWSLAIARKLQVSRQQLRALERLVVHIHAPERDAWVAMGAVDLGGLGLATARTSARAELLCALCSADGRWHAELALVLSVAPARPSTEPSAAASRLLPLERLVGADTWTRFQEIIEAIISEED